MRLSHTLQYWSLKSFAWLLCVLPRGGALALGHAIGRFGWATGMRHELVLKNIARARPDADAAELKRIGKAAAGNFGITIAEFIRYGTKHRDHLDEVIKIEGLDALKDSLNSGKGAVLLTGHFGSWALYFAAIAKTGVPLALLVGKQHNPKVDAFIHRIPGDEVTLIQQGRIAIKKILNQLQNQGAVVIVADQHAGHHGLKIPFLGEYASTLPLPGSIVAKYEPPVFLMTGHRGEDGKHTLTVAPLAVEKQATAEATKAEVMRSYNDALGAVVAAHPEHYFWYHRRWRPDDRPKG